MLLLSRGLVDGIEKVGQEGRKEGSKGRKQRKEGSEGRKEGREEGTSSFCVNVQVRPVLFSPLLNFHPIICVRVMDVTCVVFPCPTLSPPSI